MNSPEARPTPAATMPGPIRREVALGVLGHISSWGLPRLCVGKASTTAVPVVLGVLWVCWLRHIYLLIEGLGAVFRSG